MHGQLKLGGAMADAMSQPMIGRLRSRIDAVPYRTALHEDNGMVPVLAGDCR
jgi:hypothetical protein